MVIVGAGCLLGLGFIFLALAAFSSDDADTVQLSMAAVTLLTVAVACIFKLSWRLILLIVLCIGLGHLGYYRFGTAQGILTSYDVHYDNDPDERPFASSALNSVRLWYDGPQGRLPGPKLFGDKIWVEKPYRSDDGHWEFTVRSRVSQSATRIQLLLPPNGEMAFRVIKEDSRLPFSFVMQPALPFQ